MRLRPGLWHNRPCAVLVAQVLAGLGAPQPWLLRIGILRKKSLFLRRTNVSLPVCSLCPGEVPLSSLSLGLFDLIRQCDHNVYISAKKEKNKAVILPEHILGLDSPRQGRFHVETLSQSGTRMGATESV